ncbi:Uncharacterised protein [Chromobacterium violaceum]|uniref:Uncharacterized protein n=1 Tax=Chromobacterium violaceum TaxID=536 RepID=A0A447TDS2_CHRVL|nr:Uncharacterised protein [Chromobacterium violaceum]
MGNWNFRLPWLAMLLLSGCASNNPPPGAAICPQLPPAPASVMVPRQPTFLRRMETMLSDLPQKPTTLSGSSLPAKQ